MYRAASRRRCQDGRTDWLLPRLAVPRCGLSISERSVGRVGCIMQQEQQERNGEEGAWNNEGEGEGEGEGKKEREAAEA